MKEEITVIIDQLADKLQVPIAYLWDALVTQATIAGISDIITYAVFFAVVWFVFKILHKYSNDGVGDRYSDNYEEPTLEGEGKVILYTIVSGLTGVIGLISVLNLSNTLGALFNPAYWALSQLLK